MNDVWRPSLEGTQGPRQVVGKGSSHWRLHRRAAGVPPLQWAAACVDRQGDQDCDDAVTVASWRADVLVTVMLAPFSLAVLVLALNTD